MRIALVNFGHDGTDTRLTQLLRKQELPIELARALSARGHCVRLFQGFARDATLHRNSILIEGINYPSLAHGKRSMIARATGNTYLGGRDQTRRFARQILEFHPDIVHFFGCSLWADAGRLTSMLGDFRPVVTISDHGGGVGRHPYRRLNQKRFFSRLNAVFTPSAERARMWRESTVWAKSCEAVLCHETSTGFRLKGRDGARGITGFHGAPVFIWSSRLHPDKLPMAALSAFLQIGETWPDARLYMCFLTNELEDEVRRTIRKRQFLRRAVTLLGRVALSDMENIFNSGDIYLQTSRREIGGKSLTEAIACGLYPVVSDLPSFRLLTGGGEIGDLVSNDGLEDIVAVVTNRSPRFYQDAAPSIRHFFEGHLTFDVLAKKHEEAWSRGMARRNRN